MDNTITNESWSSPIESTEREVDFEIAQKYQIHYQKIKNQKDILNKGSFYSDFLNGGNAEEEFSNKIIDYRLPIRKYFDRSRNSSHARNFIKMKGYVLEVFDDVFTANLSEDASRGTFEIGEFDLNDVAPDDKDLLVKGAIFYWTFGHFSYNGQVKKMSEIRFQRLPQLTVHELDEAFDQSEELDKKISWE